MVLSPILEQAGPSSSHEPRNNVEPDGGNVRAFTRNGNDWTSAYRRPVEASTKLACETALIDGEMVVQDEHGVSDIHALRSAIYQINVEMALQLARGAVHLEQIVGSINRVK